jgi:hypothetical protein
MGNVGSDALGIKYARRCGQAYLRLEITSEQKNMVGHEKQLTTNSAQQAFFCVRDNACQKRGGG